MRVQDLHAVPGLSCPGTCEKGSRIHLGWQQLRVEFSGAASFLRRAGLPLERLGPEPVFQAGWWGTRLELCSGSRLASPGRASNPTMAVSCGKKMTGLVLPGVAGFWQRCRVRLRASPARFLWFRSVQRFCCFSCFGVIQLLMSHWLPVPIPCPLLCSRIPPTSSTGFPCPICTPRKQSASAQEQLSCQGVGFHL